MTGWVLLFATCALVGALGFSAVRYRPELRRTPARRRPERATATETPVPEPAPPLPEPVSVSQPASPRAIAPQPTASRPDEQLLVLWASQIREGKRKMTVATDGCRVTWNRSCKHGHPSWLVYLDYLSP